MYCPEWYVNDNAIQHSCVKSVLTAYLDKMSWKSNEIVLDVECGSGEVTSEILYPCIQNKIEQLVGVDSSIEMIERAKKTYGFSKLDFTTLDIENANNYFSYSLRFTKVFSFFCFHWIQKKSNFLDNIHSMLKSGGEILINFLLVNPFVALYECMDEEWHKYIKGILYMSQDSFSQDELKEMFINAGFRIIDIDSSVKKYTYPDFSIFFDSVRAVDDMYSNLPQHLHKKYSKHIKDIMYKRNMIDICPATGKTTTAYHPITVHAVKD